MPQIPKWLADTMITVANPWLRQAVVANIAMITDELKQVTFKGDFDHENFLPGKIVQFRVDDTSFRHYTLSSFNKQQGLCTVLFYLHGKGPGSQWASSLQEGQQVKFRSGEGKLQYDLQAKHHFFFGDETSIGLFNWYKTTALACSHEYFGVLELQPQHEPALPALKIMVDSVHTAMDAPAVNAITWMEDMHPDCWANWKGATFYLAGRAMSISRFKKYLLDKGVEAKQIRTDAYWADGKKGL
jgi:NADPH-dependent ferric siderophore reductase